MNLPIQLASITDTTGKITPLWFKYKDNEDFVHKSIVRSIEKRSENSVSISFTCWVIEDEQDTLRMVDISYSIREHNWTLIKRH